MRRFIACGLTVLCTAGVLVLALGQEAFAQQEKGKREEAAGKRAAREQVEKARGEYRPRDLRQAEQAEWQDGVPPGWTQGRKTGWGDGVVPPGQRRGAVGQAHSPRDYPPGAGDWDLQRREEWDRRLDGAWERVRERAGRRDGADGRDIASAAISFEAAAREGVPIEQAEAVVVAALDKGLGGREIEQVTRALAYGAGRGVAAEGLGPFATERIAAGERGDDLALAIYREADRRETQAVAAPAAPAPPPQQKKSPWWKRIFGK